MDDLGCDIRKRQDIFIFSKMPKPALGPAQPLILWVVRFLPRRYSGRLVNLRLPTSALVINQWSCTPAPRVNLHGMHSSNYKFTILVISVTCRLRYNLPDISNCSSVSFHTLFFTSLFEQRSSYNAFGFRPEQPIYLSPSTLDFAMKR